MSDEEYHPHVKFIVAFDVLHFISLITLSAVLLTAWLSPRIRRVPTWYLYIFSWIFYSLSALLIIGKQTGPEPVWGWCLFQSMMTYATPILTAASIVVFMTQIYLDIRSALGLNVLEPNNVKKLTYIPWALFITILCEVLIMGFLSPNSVSRSPSGMYCCFDISSPGRVTGVMLGICIILMAVLAGSIALTIRRNRERWQALVGSREFKSCNLLFRVAVFLVAPLCAIALVVVMCLPSGHTLEGANILFAILPTSVAIISCSQMDILRVWMFWRSSPINGVEEDKERQMGDESSETFAVQ